MPQFGEANLPASFPSWVQGGLPGILARHPHPGTPRIDGRLRWPSDANHIALHGRAWGRLFWQESQPPSNSGEYDNYETVYWDWWATSASEATGWTSKTTSGRSALLRLRHLDVLPQAGLPGSELYVEYFKDEVSLGIRTLEIPNDPIGLQWDSVISPGTVPPVHTFPTYDIPLSPGQWASLQVIPAPECYRHFDTHRTVESGNEIDPGGMAAIKVRIHSFGWGQNEFQPGGGYTKVQQSFARAIQSDWIVRPVFHGVSGWVPSRLEFKSTFFWDPVASDFPGKFGLYYGFAIRVIFNSDLFLWTLHIRTWRADDVDPSWEIPISQSLDSGVSFLLGISGALFASNFNAPAPFDSRDMKQYGIVDEIWPRFGPMGPFGLLPFDPIKVTLLSTTARERGSELPSLGTLEMPASLILKSMAAATNLGNGQLTTINFDPPVENGTDITLVNGKEWKIGPTTTKIRIFSQIDNPNSSGFNDIVTQLNGLTFPGRGYQTDRSSTGAAQSTCMNCFSSWTDVQADDIVTIQSRSFTPGGNIKVGDHSWINIESLVPHHEPISFSAVPYEESLPAPGTTIMAFRVPPSLSGYSIQSLSASLGSSRSTVGTVQASLEWIRQTGRMIEDITDDPLTIDQDHWTSDTSLNPVTTFPTALIAEEGDICMLSIVSNGIGAKGLVINFDMKEPT